MRRIALVLLLAAAGALGTAGHAAAVTWTPVDTGVADDISAVDYRGDGQVWIATTAGRIAHKPDGGVFEAPTLFPGRRFTDIAFRGTGDVGLATADAGHLFRFANGAWAPVDLSNTTFDHNCPGSGTFARDAAPTADLLAVEWSSENVAWVVSAGRGQILKSVDAGASWQDAGRQANGTCRINRDVTDVAPLNGSANDVYFVDNGGGTIWRTTDGLMTNGQQRGDLIGCSNVLAKVAADLNTPARVSVAAPCGGAHWGFSPDGGVSPSVVQSHTNAALRDIAAGAGVILAVGDNGTIEQSFDGARANEIPAAGALASRNWRAVDITVVPGHAAVAGEAGALVLTDQANQPPQGGTGPGGGGGGGGGTGGGGKVLRIPRVTVTFLFNRPGRTTTLTQLTAANIPAGSKVVARCVDRRGRRCGGKLRKAFTKRNARGTVRVKRPVIRRAIKAGSRIEVVVTNPDYVTQIKIIKIRRGKAPGISTRCQRPGAKKRTRC